MTGRDARGARARTGRAVPQDLIHTNNSPKPVTARVSGRFDPPEIVVFDVIAEQLARGLETPFVDRGYGSYGRRDAKSTP